VRYWVKRTGAAQKLEIQIRRDEYHLFPYFSLGASLTKKRGIRKANGVRDAAAFPLHPDKSSDVLRFEVGAMRRLPLLFSKK
jgi:hypothetical protein